eukprot:TRINITY_DN43352_c0_g1_i2.p1 TRINITY_DN43352_c0_g1~~TRINITY_DN43352_c0_g1_i2.p1  ORF type:complete len:183 (-),score=28.08 TRINITY_DN43352_c0_g1_i2:135-683(-)
MAIEVTNSALPSGFNLVIGTAENVTGPYSLRQNLQVGDKGLMFGPGSCPAIRYDHESEYWHLLYTPNPTVPRGGYRTWQIYAARSKSLRFGDWELSPMNPVMVADALDREIQNPAIPEAQREIARTTQNLNDSDPDLVEFGGQVLLVLNWGDQKSTPTNSLAQAMFNGTMSEFWQSLYPAWP